MVFRWKQQNRVRLDKTKPKTRKRKGKLKDAKIAGTFFQSQFGKTEKAAILSLLLIVNAERLMLADPFQEDIQKAFLENFERAIGKKENKSVCPKCKMIYYNLMTKEFIEQIGECPACDHVAGDIDWRR